MCLVGRGERSRASVCDQVNYGNGHRGVVAAIVTARPIVATTIGQTWGCLIQIDYDNSTDKEAVSILPISELQAV